MRFLFCTIFIFKSIYNFTNIQINIESYGLNYKDYFYYRLVFYNSNYKILS